MEKSYIKMERLKLAVLQAGINLDLEREKYVWEVEEYNETIKVFKEVIRNRLNNGKYSCEKFVDKLQKKQKADGVEQIKIVFGKLITEYYFYKIMMKKIKNNELAIDDFTNNN